MTTSTQNEMETTTTLERTPRIALLGNPNTGKTTVYNALCGANQRTGNFPGVTVERKTGAYVYNDVSYDVIDLPGIYSLKAVSPDEEAATQVIMGRIKGEKKPDVVLFILDSTNLKRNLFLYTQVVELGLPVVIALTMTDLLKREGVDLDIEQLRKDLGVPIIPVIGRTNSHIAALKEALSEAVSKKDIPRSVANFPEDIRGVAHDLRQVLEKYTTVSEFEARELLFFNKCPIMDSFAENEDAKQLVYSAREKLTRPEYGNPSYIALQRYASIDSIIERVEKREMASHDNISSKLDSIFTHRIFGLGIFIVVMYLVFQAIYSWSGPMMDGIDITFSSLGDFLGIYLQKYPMVRSLVVDGAISGVGSVMIFLPQIVILFFFIAFMEDSGYLARSAFLMDRLLGWTGLNGRAFIPMLSSFACSIPGVMSTRIMPDPRARLSTILIAPLMSCSARLPVYMLFIGAFIEPQFGAGWAALSLFAMHALGLFLALPIAWILNRGVIEQNAIPFILEMPPYRIPQLYNLWRRTYEAGREFVVKAGSVIFALSIIIWALSYFPRDPEIAGTIENRYAERIEVYRSKQYTGEDGMTSEDIEKTITELATEKNLRIKARYLEDSYLGRAGKTIQPVFSPLGFDWRLSVGIISAFPAREVIVATLGIIFNVSENVDQADESMKIKLRSARNEDGGPLYTTLTAVSLMVFFALSSQCMSTLAVVKKELNSYKWALFLFVYMTTLAYIISFIVYQGGVLLGLG